MAQTAQNIRCDHQNCKNNIEQITNNNVVDDGKTIVGNNDK